MQGGNVNTGKDAGERENAAEREPQGAEGEFFCRAMDFFVARRNGHGILAMRIRSGTARERMPLKEDESKN